MNQEVLAHLIDTLRIMGAHAIEEAAEYSVRAADFIGSPFEMEEICALRDYSKGQAYAFALIATVLTDIQKAGDAL